MPLVLTALIIVLGHVSGDFARREILERAILHLELEQAKVLLKEISTCIRRTGKLSDGTRIDASVLGALAYWELATGRSKYVTQWHDEVDNRCIGKKHIVLPDDTKVKNGMIWQPQSFADLPVDTPDMRFHEQMACELQQILSDLLPIRPVKERIDSRCHAVQRIVPG